MFRPASLAPLAALALASGLLSGCALQTTAAPGPVDGAAFGGRIMGGQQPVSGASVLVVTAAVNGYDNGSSGTLATTTTDAAGNYSFPANSYTCPTSTTPILIAAVGGNPGLAAGTNNSAIHLVAYAGPCGALTATTVIQINEVTTVAAAYALRPFLTNGAVSTSASNTIGLTHAFGTYNNLVNNATGTSPGANVPAGVIIPTALINSLANSIAACVNSTSYNSSSCSSLFFYANTPATGPYADVFIASAGIATTPTRLVSQIYSLASATPPFAPALTSAPPDWSVVVNHTSGYLGNPQPAFDIDRSGNLWVGTNASGYSTLEVLTNSGASIKRGSGAGYLNGLSGVVVNADGSAVVATRGTNPGLYTFDNTGTQHIYYSGDTPKGLSLGSGGNYIFVDLAQPPQIDNIASDFSYYHHGTSAFTPSLVSFLGADGSYWVSDSDVAGFEVFSNLDGTGTRTFYSATSDCAMTFGPNAFYCLNSSSSPAMVYHGSTLSIAVSSYAGFPSTSGQIDGTGQLWAANLNPSASLPFRVARFSTPATSGTYSGAAVLANTFPTGNNNLQIDDAGNVWVTSTSYSIGLSEIVGAASPTRTPKSRDSQGNTFGTRP